jgi:predicted secreted protein
VSITAVIVVYAITWFMVFFIVLPLRFVSQADSGTVVPGTPSSAPAEEVVRRKAWITTIAATVIWALICAVILSGVISVRDFDFRGTMGPAPAAGDKGE